MKLIHGDSLEKLKDLEDNSIDTIITDPPYGLSFMGKKWDYDVPQVELWQECLRVLKPGGTALIFAGSRTQHRMAVNVEDAGFILKDCIMWLYGSGFPKATDISKQLDKGHKRKVIGKKKSPDGVAYEDRQPKEWKPQGFAEREDYKRDMVITEPATEEAKLWNGWKSHGLKPAYEPILVAMKPNDGTYANNALTHGVSGLNIDGGRIGYEDKSEIDLINKRSGKSTDGKLKDGFKGYADNQGRFPANLLLSCYCELQGLNLSNIMEDINNITTLCQSNHLKLPVTNVEKRKYQEDTSKKLETLFATESVDMLSLEKILGKMLESLSSMDMSDSEETLMESMKQSLSTFISGSNQTEQYQKDMKCTTSMVLEMITGLKTCNACLSQTIEVLHTKVRNGIQELKKEKSHQADCPIKMLDEQSLAGGMHSAGNKSSGKEMKCQDFGVGGEAKRERLNTVRFGDKGGASRFFKSIKQDELDEIQEDTTSMEEKLEALEEYTVVEHPDWTTWCEHTDNKRFFYCAKASKSERNKGLDCYLTVKYDERINTNKDLCKEENTGAVQLLQKVISEQELVSFSTGESGENIMVQCHKDSLSIILTKINKIIELKTLNLLMHSLTNESTADVNCEMESGGNLAESVENLRKYLLTITKENQELALGASNVALKVLSLISEKENWKTASNFHSTVKPVKLMEYLCTLTKTPTGGIVLDPFMGSGTTGVACKSTDREFIGIEREEEYIKIAKARIENKE